MASLLSEKGASIKPFEFYSLTVVWHLKLRSFRSLDI